MDGSYSRVRARVRPFLLATFSAMKFGSYSRVRARVRLSSPLWDEPRIFVATPACVRG
jgi:hypothetical protein